MKKEEQKTEAVLTKFSPSTMRKLKVLAEKEARKPGQLVRVLVERALGNEQICRKLLHPDL